VQRRPRARPPSSNSSGWGREGASEDGGVGDWAVGFDDVRLLIVGVTSNNRFGGRAAWDTTSWPRRTSWDSHRPCIRSVD
jgi:hypothetical protein